MKLDVFRKGIKNIAMPRIACGLDGLIWRDVRDIIIKEFENTGINIVICNI